MKRVVFFTIVCLSGNVGKEEILRIKYDSGNEIIISK